MLTAFILLLANPSPKATFYPFPKPSPKASPIATPAPKKEEPLPWIFPPPAPVDDSADEEVFPENLGY